MTYGGLNKYVDAAAKIGDEQAQAKPSRETKYLGRTGTGKIIIIPVWVTTSRIGNLTRLNIYEHTTWY